MINQEVEILLVEDNLYDAELAIRALKKTYSGGKFLHAKDGAEAIDFLFGTGPYTGRDPQNGPKLVLLDLKMPRVNGLEVLQKVKSDPMTKKIPVVVLTSSNEQNDINECYQSGANSYIVKPVEFGEFMKAIGEIGSYWMQLCQTYK